MSTLLGTLLNGRYRLDAHVGAGGMSVVYKAFDTVLERPVAIKLMHRETASDADQLERFRREARAVAQLSHPHIVTVIDVGEDDGDGTPTPYIVFEYVDGETLKERIRRAGQLPIPEAVAYAIEVARALGAAHERAIVHRDVKPQNILIDPEGRAKITDFGIARTLTEEGLTVDGKVLGTTDYVSPEQALGHAVTGQSDLYSLGVVLYEMLTGRVPFSGENQVAVAMRHVRDDIPDVQHLRPKISSALAAVLDRATAKSLERRYPDAATMLRDLEESLAIETARAGQATGEATTVLRTLRGSARRRLPLRMRHPAAIFIAAAAILAVAAAGVLVLAASHTHRGVKPPPDVNPPRHANVAVPVGQNAAHDYNPFGDTAEHPEQVQFAIDGDPNTVWNTEIYRGGKLNKPGVGFYVDAAPRVVASAVSIETPTPGFDVEIWAARRIRPFPQGDRSRQLPARGWVKVGRAVSVQGKESVALDTAGQAFRYYLLWITKLPPGENRVQVAEFVLFR